MATRKTTATTEKKTTTRKAPAKKAAAPVELQESPVQAGTATPVQKNPPSYEEIAQLAQQYWVERGRPHGSPEVDWLRAEQTLHAA